MQIGLRQLLGIALLVAVAGGCASSKTAVSPTVAPVESPHRLPDIELGGGEDSLYLARSLFLLAQELENRGIQAGVDLLLYRAYSFDPSNRWLGFRLVESQLAAGHQSEAQQLFPKIAALEGDTTVSQYLLLSQLWRQSNQLDSALSVLSRGEELDDEHIRLLYEKVLVLEAMGRLKEMSQVHTRLVRLLDYPTELVWKQVYLNTMLRDHAAQEQLYRELWKLQGDSWGLELLKLLFEQKQQLPAIEVAKKLLESSPNEPELQNILLHLLQETGKDRETIEALHRFYGADSSRHHLLEMAGRLEIKVGMVEEGVKHLLYAADKNPLNSQTHLFLSMGLAQQGELEKALELIDRALLIDSADVMFHTQKVLVLMAGSRFKELDTALIRWNRSGADTSTLRDLQSFVWVNRAFHLEEKGERGAADSLRLLALPILQKGVEKGGTLRPSGLFELATTLERLDRFDEAKLHFERLLAHEPQHAEALNYYGYSLLVHGGSILRADTLINRALAIDPSNEAFLDSKAWSLHLQGRHAEALEILDGLEQRGKLLHGELLEHKALVLEALGRLTEALNSWKRLVELHPIHAKTIGTLPKELSDLEKSTTEPLPEQKSP